MPNFFFELSSKLPKTSQDFSDIPLSTWPQIILISGMGNSFLMTWTWSHPDDS